MGASGSGRSAEVSGLELSAKQSGDTIEEPAGGLGRFYGRRQGHKLRPRQKQLVNDLLPRLEVERGESDSPIDPAELFDKAGDEIWLEIGFGGGEHLTAQASEHPDNRLIGCEFFINGIAKALAEIDERNLENIRLYTGDARVLLKGLRPQSIDRVFVLYPDPWPKLRHHKRRMISDWSLAEFARILKPGGLLRVVSDIPDYCAWTLEHIRRDQHFEWNANGPEDWRQPPADWKTTRYEQKALREGRIPTYLTFTRKG